MLPTDAAAPDVRRIEAAVDRLLLERGEVDPLECLLELGVLAHPEYLRWRRGESADLQSLLRLSAEDVAGCLEHMQGYAAAQGLVPLSRVPQRWDDSGRPLMLGPLPRLSALCSHALLRSADRSQLDLFQDSAWTAASREIRRALSERRFEAARQLIERWTGDPLAAAEVAGYRRLLEAASSSFHDHAEHLRQLESEIVPLALRLLGTQARDYCAPLWASLAEALEGLPFLPETPALHASYAQARAGDWGRVLASAEAEPELLRHGVLLARIVDAGFRLRQADAAHRAWAQLCWRHPQEAERAIENRSLDTALQLRWRRFLDSEPVLATGDFPAWLLLTGALPRNAVPPDLAPDSGAGPAYGAAHRLVCSGGAMSERRALAAVNAELLQHYLASVAAVRET